MDIKFLAFKERIQSGQLSTKHACTNSMIADPLAKRLPPKIFHEHVARMGVVSLKDIQFQWEFVFICSCNINIFHLFQFMDISGYFL